MSNKDSYDVIIVGTGPAGIFAALELVKKDGLKILMLEKGPDIEQRFCPARKKKCTLCQPCSITCGWGGAGAFSDGKLTLSPLVGGWLDEYLPREELQGLIDYVDNLYLEFGAPERVYGDESDETREIERRCVLADLQLVTMRVRHLGTENCETILKRMKQALAGRADVKTKTTVEHLLVEKGRVVGVETSAGTFRAPHVIVAPGREGADWLQSETRRLGMHLITNAVDIGVRVETAAPIMEALTKHLYESKLVYYSKAFQDKVRTFCMSPYGEVSTESYGDVITVNGHSYAERKTENTNFALLVSTTFTEPFKEPIAYGKYIARLANLLGEGIIVQRLGDLKAGRRSTAARIDKSVVRPTMASATPGDLSFVLPYRYITNILEMLEAMEKVAPGVNGNSTLLYGVEVKFYSSRVRLSPQLETEIDGLYAIGDGAGVSRGLIQSSCSGVIAARAILKNADVRR
ncbi:MAG: NAD(P)/FAD-dependent oxidoreductase [Actinobacteria bacterium]|nr:MAG: NAD(P)/FAD-dependent oxidoreductase [Actinomycetota bacterium]